jgi:hypothetical protein
MKKFLLFLLFTLTAFFAIDRALALVLDWLYLKTRTGQTGGKINRYLEFSPQPHLVIMGNSRALYQIIPDSFKIRAFNLSHAGMGPMFQTGLLSILEKENKIPRILVLLIEPYEFDEEYPNTDVQNLKYYYGSNTTVSEYINTLSPYEHLKFNFDLYRHNGRFVSLVKNYAQTMRSGAHGNGYEIIPPSPRDSINTIYSFDKLPGQAAEKINMNQLAVLQTFISLAKKHKVKLICFTSPVFRGINQYPKTTELLDSLLKVNNIPYINFTKKPILHLEQNARLWKDAHHLNHEGAQIESGVLMQVILKILENK